MVVVAAEKCVDAVVFVVVADVVIVDELEKLDCDNADEKVEEEEEG